MHREFGDNQHLGVEASCLNMSKMIEELQSMSPFKRVLEEDGKEFLVNPEGERFLIDHITNPEDPRIENLHSFLEETFTAEEADTVDTIKEAIESRWGDYGIIQNEKGEIVAHSCVSYFDCRMPEGNTLENLEPKEGTLYMGYVITKPEYRRKKFAFELYQKAFAFAMQEARNRQSKIKGVIGETVEDKEQFFNRMGRKRLYYEDPEGNVREVKYFCAPHDWDLETGEPNLDPTPEHLMFRFSDNRQEMSVNELLSMVKAIYKENYIFPEKTLPLAQARENNQKFVLGMLGELREELEKARDGKIFLMSKEEREQKRRELEELGKKLFDIIVDFDSDGKKKKINENEQ